MHIFEALTMKFRYFVCFMLFHVVACILFYLVALLTAYFRYFYWLLKKINQSENASESYHGTDPGVKIDFTIC